MLQLFDDCVNDIGDPNIPAEFLAECGDACIANTARHDAMVRIEGVVAVQCKAMHRDALGDSHTDRGDLSSRTAVIGRHPDASAVILPFRGDAVVGADGHDRGFESMHIRHDVYGGGQAKYGVARELPRPMPSDATAAIYVNDWRAVHGSIFRLGALACCVDRLMFDQKHGGGSTRNHSVMDFALLLPAVDIGRQRFELAHDDEGHGGKGTAANGLMFPSQCGNRFG